MKFIRDENVLNYHEQLTLISKASFLEHDEIYSGKKKEHDKISLA